MGEMADMALDEIAEWEDICDDYVAGGIRNEEAFELGILDEIAGEPQHLHAAWERVGPLAEESLDRAIGQVEFAPLGHVTRPNNLNAAAIANLKKDVPTCNICSVSMQPRTGRFGKFYFCNCPGQKTVSDTYWQSIKSN